ncbi:hypothetical protein [Emticicia agri]|uniref:Uncharacterized protein n=1 Tax=Emticicia agri TaxID=2492393 RepID=A0A4Q5LU62_9BACT|nr:hypothetical protein [Emticicia agri]RYU93037.1 hypothetical protein EWM59_24110 [Emticicia agri]
MNLPNTTITFHLKQHTPLIHFQHEQDGATLRAKELRPALDKYLWAKAFKNDFNAYKKFLIDPSKFEGGNIALDYKINIDYSKAEIWKSPIERPKIKFDRQTGKQTLAGPEQFPCFFGNMGETNTKQFSMAEGIIEVSFFSFKTELLNHIKNHFTGFIERKNFGTRQSKGFGAFWLINQQVAPGVNKFKFKSEITYREQNVFKDYKLRYPDSDLNNDKILLLERYWQVFKQIELFWKVARSGYSDGRRDSNNYIKAPLVFYLNDYFEAGKSYFWDKKNIKLAYKDNALVVSPNNLLARDLLGLASESDWKSDNVVVKKNHTEDEIDRYKSPITFKPRWNEKTKSFDVFIYLNPVEKGFLDKSFRIEWKKRGERVKNNLILKTPPAFGITKYFRFLNGVYKDSILPDFIQSTSNNDLKQIEKIFETLTEFNNPNP